MGLSFPSKRVPLRAASWSPACIACSTLLAAGVAHADLDLSVGVGAGYSDNIARTATNERDEKIGTAKLDLTWREQTRRIDGDAHVDLSYYDYLDNTFSSEVVGTADGRLSLQLVPEYMTWLFQDSFGQAQSDPFVPVTPANRENLNYFTTGPDFFLRLGSAAQARLFGRYSRTDYERSPLDADRKSGGVGLMRSGGRGELSLNAVTETTDFKQNVNPDYDRDNVFVRYRLVGARTELISELGYTWIQRDGSDKKDGGALVNIEVQRDISASSTLRLRLGQQLTDSGEALRGALEGGGAPGAGGSGPDITATADPFQNRQAGLEWRFARNRTSFVLGSAWYKDEYETQTQLDRRRIVYSAEFTRQLGPTLELGLLANLADEKFENVDLDSDESVVGALLNWRPGEHFGFTFTVNRYDRSTSSGLGEYKENRAFLLMTWRPREPAATPPRSTRQRSTR